MNCDALDNRRKVLVIDDDAVMRITAQDYLEEGGFEVVEAADGRSGISCFLREAVDAVVLDITMPDIDGFEVCQRLRSSPGGKHVPILMVTGTDDVESVNKAFHLGATDFSAKPINYDLLVHRIRYMLRTSEMAAMLREREASLAYAQRIARLGNWEYQVGSDRMELSPILAQLMDVERRVLDQHAFLGLIHPADRAATAEAMEAALVSAGTSQCEFRLLREDGSIAVMEQDMQVQLDRNGTAMKMVGAVHDITERRNAEDRIRTLAYVDNVTGLANRTLFEDHLDLALNAARRHQRVLSVMFIDLDHFKRINDTWGHAAGDEVLREVARRVKLCLRECDVVTRETPHANPEDDGAATVARLGGDEFVVLLPEIARAEDAARVARRVIDMLCTPIAVADSDVQIGCSIGISVFPDDAEDASSLLKQADSAMYEVKSEGRNGYQFFTPAIQNRVFARMSIETSLRRALENDEFCLNYQPRIDARSGRIVGMEALVRWDDPRRGMIPPGEFISVAEETGQIVALGEWVLGAAVAQTRRWHDAGLGPLRVSVNLSAAQLHGHAVVEQVKRALDTYGLPPAALELELTESTLITDEHGHLELLRELSGMGITLSIDDFGTGYSSLSYLKRLPVRYLKIDRSFVRDMDSEADDAAIVEGTISLAHSLRLGVVAEGVERESQQAMLRSLNCDELQGFLYSKPLDAATFEAWLRKSNRYTRLARAV